MVRGRSYSPTFGKKPRWRHSIYYEQYDAAYLAMTPARWSAAATQALFNPFNPFSYTPAGRMLSATADVFSGVTRKRGKPAWNLPAAIDAIDDRPFGRLIRFTAAGTSGDRPRVLLVAPMSGHYATLLRNTAEVLMSDHDVYVTDWADARDVALTAGRFDLGDYVAYVMDWIRRARAGRARDRCLPARAGGARRRRAARRGRRSRAAALDDADGRPG